jgi:DNA-binding PadR family transcriptional regulator
MVPVRTTIQTQAVLAALLEDPQRECYGLELADAAGLKRGTLYPILARLEAAGWLSSRWEEVDESVEGRRRRRYYRLTGEGEMAASQVLEATSRKLRLQPPRPGWAGGVA